jgi:hypothetical protein
MDKGFFGQLDAIGSFEETLFVQLPHLLFEGVDPVLPRNVHMDALHKDDQ